MSDQQIPRSNEHNTQPPTGSYLPPQPAPHQQVPQQAPQPGAQVPQEPGQPMYAWQMVQVPVQMRETEPLEYHRLLRGIKNYRWWKPLVMILIAGAYYLTLSFIVGIIAVVVLTTTNPEVIENPDIAFETLASLDTQNPISIAIGLISIIVMIPALWLAQLSIGIRPWGRGWSVALRIRWGLLFRSVGWALLALIVMNLVGIGLGMLFSNGSDEAISMPENFDLNAAIISFVLVLLLVPFQAAAEEYVFRGGLMQVLGAWIKSPIIAILLTSVLFAVAHIYDIWGMLSVGVMGVVAAYLTWRTGGLEAAIAVHTLNNYIAFGFMASGITGETSQTVEGAGPGDVISSLLGLGFFVLVIELMFRRGQRQGRWARTRIDLVPVQPQVPQLQVPPQPPVPPQQYPGQPQPPYYGQPPQPQYPVPPQQNPGSGEPR